MANQRPIRVPPHARRRWRRGPQRPRRWIEGNSHQAANEICVFDTTNGVLCDPGTPRVLLAGDSDIEWADRSEVRCDRLLGQLTWHAWNLVTSPVDIAPWVVRFGVLAVEETDGLFQSIDLFDRESLEEYQWMWLYQTIGEASFYWNPELTQQLHYQQENIPIDIATRRTMGKKDSIVLYSQARRQATGTPFASINSQLPTFTYQLRSVLRA